MFHLLLRCHLHHNCRVGSYLLCVLMIIGSLSLGSSLRWSCLLIDTWDLKDACLVEVHITDHRIAADLLHVVVRPLRDLMATWQVWGSSLVSR